MASNGTKVRYVTSWRRRRIRRNACIWIWVSHCPSKVGSLAWTKNALASFSSTVSEWITALFILNTERRGCSTARVFVGRSCCINFLYNTKNREGDRKVPLCCVILYSVLHLQRSAIVVNIVDQCITKWRRWGSAKSLKSIFYTCVNCPFPVQSHTRFSSFMAPMFVSIPALNHNIFILFLLVYFCFFRFYETLRLFFNCFGNSFRRCKSSRPYQKGFWTKLEEFFIL